MPKSIALSIIASFFCSASNAGVFPDEAACGKKAPAACVRMAIRRLAESDSNKFLGIAMSAKMDAEAQPEQRCLFGERA